MATRRLGNININFTPSEASTQMYNTLGRSAGVGEASGNNDNFFVKRGKSIENAIGTTLAAPVSFVNDRLHRTKTNSLLEEGQNKLNDIAKKYGYDSMNSVWDARDAAEEAGDTAKVAEIDNTVAKELQNQANANLDTMKQNADEYRDYRQNNYISNKINQDQGKFAGSAINTWNTMADVLLPGAGVAFNAVQGVGEGIADELEQNGFENFDWGRAGQNALIGGITGGVVGKFNQGLTNSLAKRAAAKGLQNTEKGVLKTIATGAGRGALSGAVGGATGAGLSSALNGVDLGQGIQNTVQGALQGAKSGAIAGGTMAGANWALNKTPGVGKVMQNINQASEDWKNSGENFNERLTNTLTSGDSAVGNWLQGARSKTLGRLGMVGDTIRDYTDQGLGPRNAEREAFRDLIETHNEDNGLDGALENAKAAGYPNDSNFRKALRAVEGGDYAISYDDAFNELKDVYGDSFNPDIYLNKDGSYKYKNGEPYVWTVYKNKLAMVLGNELDARENGTTTFKDVTRADDIYSPGSEKEGYVPGIADNYETAVKARNNQKTKTDTPTTLGGWLKKAGERTLEDINNSNMGLRVKDVSKDYTDDIRNMQINDNTVGNINNSSETELYRMLTGDGETQTAQNTFPKAQATTTANSSWDKLAQEGGYSSYNDLVQSFMEANPNAKVSAGAVTTWMDENPGNWNPNMPMSNKLDTVFEPETSNKIQSKNKLQSIGKQLQTAAEDQKYMALKDSLDAKTAQRATKTGAIQQLSKLGVAPENYLESAKTSNYVNKVVSDLAKESGVKVNVPDMADRLAAAADDVVFTTADAQNKFDRTIRQIVADGSSPDEYSASYLIEKSRDIGNKAAKISGNTADKEALRTAYTNVKYILRDEATNALDKANVTGDSTNTKIGQGLAKMGANQKVQDYYTQTVDGKAPTASDYIRRSAVFEQARDMGTQLESEKYTRSASKAPTNPLTKIWNASGLDQPVNIVLKNTVAPVASTLTKGAGKAIEGAGDLLANAVNNTPTENVSTTTSGNNYNPSTQIYNAIGRTEGATNAQQARTSQYIADAVNNADTLENLAASNTSNSATSVYNSIYGQPTSTNGDYWTSILSNAMQMAMDNNDANSYVALMNMYNEAVNNNSSSSDTKLTDKQRQANAAARALADFEGLESNFGYDVSDIPLLGNIANWGGNEYASKAEALALQIGYMLSGATVNKEEAKSIGMAYVPQPRDSEAIRRSKLAQLRGIISDYQQS